MESAGKYWFPVFNILEKNCFVTLAHPKYTKPQRGNKTDLKDAKWICDLFMCDMIQPSFMDGANASAMVYTMVEMAKAHDRNIFGYLKSVPEHRPTKKRTDEQLAELAPWSKKLQAIKNRI